MIEIRSATADDIPFITEVYNDAIINTTATFDTEVKSIEDRMLWFKNHDGNHPIIVAENDGVLSGWASLTAWSDRCAYNGTAEVSVYVHKEHRGRGIGKALLEILILKGESKGLHYLLSRIASGNEASIHLHTIFGFRHIGIMKEVGFKFGNYVDVHLMELLFKTTAK
ncbi:MAG TPA: N-acetyltransferase family protein [Bacteroidia bacterium]|nr:N-acetyltransferase family protein [Bacteroidia bacterium]HMY64813.1 N-acetyltransferase family protein [Bacteroidia bacterium]HND72401.1 N-acetyltransferase family protein [Bacteroidia bacterium]HNF41530.1 N-acetyltransferase family protein [Bacteroidia bacterium]HNJ32378.1 N-acetyltransferase family protein [Bacteroidia bacterium]